MTNEEAMVFMDNLIICIKEHPILADWLVEIENRKTEPIKCPKCGRSDYIRSFEDWGIDGGIYKYKCINCNTYIKYELPTDPLTAKCLNCTNSGSYKCTKCNGEMYFKSENEGSE